MPGLLAPHLRRFRSVLAVCRTGSTAQAALILPLSQSAIARAIRELEDDLARPLFERAARGMLPTPVGRLLSYRAERAMAQLQLAETELKGHDQGSVSLTTSRFVHTVGYRHLQTFIIFCETRSETIAAQRLGVSQPAVNQTLRQLSHLLGCELFQRSARGVRLTENGEALLRRVKLALAEFRHAAEDLAAFDGRMQGRIVIGSLPLSAGVLVPRAVDRMLVRRHDLKVTIVDGTYDGLMYQLRHADIDVVVGALRPGAPGSDVVQTPLFEDTLSVVVRRGHPLEKQALKTLRDVVDQPWIAPLSGTPAREAFERAFRAAGVAPPSAELEVNSAIVLQALLQDSNRLALLSRRQIFHGISSGVFSILPIAVEETSRQIGLTMRADADPSASIRLFIQELQVLAKELS
ncbi:LysR family transcriptional regulator [Pusillimonas sp. DMV24BSW_D]|uniref:LysR family transcriptional regulator n=1 Tax=Neopusillimonas aestuarii TaxID=2716226 RepID=UPI00140DBBF4|nr:LysR family transcriptional regulator [Pusillimonas sp. DMV24BSW_D]QIM48405.1 LysR family transcriptional regulator [Pusillimonas sp. DMV24BSW_D]